MSIEHEVDDAAAMRVDGRSGEGPGIRKGNRTRRALLALIGVLYLISVPWYRDTDAPLRLVLGLPDWVAVSLGCYLAVAILNAWAWLSTDFPDDPLDFESHAAGTDSPKVRE